MVVVFDIGGLVHHAHVVEDIVLAEDELEEYDADGPDIDGVGLLLVAEDALDRHEGLRADFVRADYLGAFYDILIEIDALGVLVLLLFLESVKEILVELGESVVDEDALALFRVVEEVARLDVAVVDPEVLEDLDGGE